MTFLCFYASLSWLSVLFRYARKRWPYGVLGCLIGLLVLGSGPAASAFGGEPLPSTAIPASPSPAQVIFDPDPFEATMIESEQAALVSLDDPTHYTLDVTVDWQDMKVSGTERVLYTNNETEALPDLYLRLYPNARHYAEGELAVEKVMVNGQEGQFRVDGTILEVHLAEPLPPEKQVELNLDFVVTVPHRDDRFGYYEGVMALGHWYPMMAVYDDEGWNLDPYVEMGDAFYSEVSMFTVNLTVPQEVVVVSSGLLADSVSQDDGAVRLTCYSGATRDFALALSPDYQVVSDTVGETTINSYYLPGDEEGGQDALQYAVDSVEVYNEYFGLYPYTELDVVETHFTVQGSPGGMEFPGLVIISSELYSGFFQEELDTVVAHEVAHQWWYGVVGNNQVDEPWLDESFATYSSIIYYEFAQGKGIAQAQLMLQAEAPFGLIAVAGLDAPVNSSLLDFDDPLHYQAIVYSKGTLFLDKLRQAVGDEAFFGILQSYYRKYKYGVARPEDFRRMMEEGAGDNDAATLYERWILKAEGIEGLDELPRLEELGPLLQMLLGAEWMEAEDWEELEKALWQLLEILGESGR